ncbi:hypothetical protein [Clostridium sp.]|uniref:hypothetical protein n=1 Tax=Clostridium sp. TaxID=1506 RepID=UPI0025BD76C7|nr:hypothetical protein [Clostridium sp.]MCI9069401.1 hypothetical protein [Clostridium sp.]
MLKILLITLILGWILELAGLFYSIKIAEKKESKRLISIGKRFLALSIIGGILTAIGWYGSYFYLLFIAFQKLF